MPLSLQRGRLGLRVLTAAEIDIDERWGDTPIRWWFWRLYRFSEAGAVARWDNGQQTRFAADRFYVLPAGLRFARASSRAMRHLYVHFSVEGLPQSLWLDALAGVQELPAQPSLATQADNMVRNLAGSRDLNAMLSATALVSLALESAVASLPAAARDRLLNALSAPDRLARARELALAARGRLSVAELAAASHLSTDHFSRIFREAHGAGPASYLQELRAQAAADALLADERSIDQIAEECGFSDRYHLTRVFTRWAGTSPAAFRRLHRPRAKRNR